MATKPIIFSSPMVKAILNGDKTMTRRVIKGFLPEEIEAMGQRLGYCANWWKSTSLVLHTPYKPGDILWVRETWGAWSPTEGIMPRLYYRADGDAPSGIKWRPSIHMPKEAARIFLRVTDVRMEHLRDITGNLNDLEREGINIATGMFEASMAFGKLWDSLRKPADLDKYDWDANPWVWVISFERTEANTEAEMN